MSDLATITLPHLLIGFLPVAGVLLIMWRWRIHALDGLIANLRMLLQLLAVGYVLTFIFNTEQPLIVGLVLAVMLGVASWIALRPLEDSQSRPYALTAAAIGVSGVAILLLTSQWVLQMPRWFEPRVVVPLGGMIFANAMNTVSLAAERWHAELENDPDVQHARHAAMDAAMIPQINSLLAVGLVALPGMMTGQILSGVDPLIAVRYQIMVMCMIFSSSGLAAAMFLYLMVRRQLAR